MAEQMANRSRTTLTSAAGDSDPVLVVDDITSFPGTGNFRVRVNDELLLVTDVNVGASTFTVTRGIEGTTAAAHAAGDEVVHVLTKQGLLNIITENAPAAGDSGNVITSGTFATRPAAATAGNVYVPTDTSAVFLDTGSAWKPLAPLAVYPAIVHAEYSKPWTDDIDSSLYIHNGSAYYHGNVNDNGGDHYLHARVKAHTFPAPLEGDDQTVILGLMPAFPPDASGPECGLLIRNSSTGAMLLFGVSIDLTTGCYTLNCSTWTDRITRTQLFSKKIVSVTPIWLTVTRSWLNGNYTFYYSVDGYLWIFLQLVTASNLSSPDQIGFGLNAKSNSSTLFGMRILQFETFARAHDEFFYEGAEPSYN